MSRRSVRWVFTSVLASGVGYVAYWFAAGRITETYSNDVGSVLVSADGRTISASAPEHQIGDYAENTSNNLVAAELARSVTMRVHTRIVHGFGLRAPGVTAAPVTLSISLSAPLWGRALVGGDGRPLAYFDGRTMLTPHPAPPGFHLSAVYPGSSRMGALRDPGPAAVQVYNSDVGASLMIGQQVGGGWTAPPATTVADVLVRGYPARVYTSDGFVVVQWAQSGQSVQVLYVDHQAPNDASMRDFAVAIAQSLR